MTKLDTRARCQAMARHGGRCRRPALPGRPFCAAHAKPWPAPDAERCQVVTASTGERCAMYAAPGDTVCALHRAWEHWKAQDDGVAH